MMGGISKWNVLSDSELSNVMPEAFGDIPEVSAGLLYREAAAVWRSWNPLFWLAIRFRGCLTETPKDDDYRQVQSRPPSRPRFLRRLLVSHCQRLTGALRRDIG
jgi:hypothetical protein